MLLVANFANTKNKQKTSKTTETLANGYSSESTQWELSNEYQHFRVQMVFKNLCLLVLLTRVAHSVAAWFCAVLEGAAEPATPVDSI